MTMKHLSTLALALLACITHAQAALHWDACPWGQSASGSACTGTLAPLTWQQALQAAQTANAAMHQGHADWRVPNRTELESTVDLAAPGAGTFWSSTSYHPAPTQAWTVDFADGASHPATKAAALALRLVRGGTAAQAFQSAGPAATPALPLPSQPGETAQATVTGGGAGCGFTHAQFVAPSAMAAPPAHVTLAADLFEFILEGCTPGGTVQIAITYPQALAANQFWKHGPRPGLPAGWYAYPHASITGSTVTLTLTDGALGDDDLDATNGRIVDAGGPALLAAGPAGAAAIPTLSQWGVLLLALVMGVFGLQRFSSLRKQLSKTE